VRVRVPRQHAPLFQQELGHERSVTMNGRLEFDPRYGGGVSILNALLKHGCFSFFPFSRYSI
jgi:hypothetical protein